MLCFNYERTLIDLALVVLCACISLELKYSVFILEQLDHSYCLASLNISWLVLAKIECAVHVSLPRWDINQFKSVKQR